MLLSLYSIGNHFLWYRYPTPSRTLHLQESEPKRFVHCFPSIFSNAAPYSHKITFTSPSFVSLPAAFYHIPMLVLPYVVSFSLCLPEAIKKVSPVGPTLSYSLVVLFYIFSRRNEVFYNKCSIMLESSQSLIICAVSSGFLFQERRNLKIFIPKSFQRFCLLEPRLL